MRHYEAVVIFQPHFAGESLEQAKRNFQDQVKRFGGNVLHTQELGKRSIGFSIKKKKEGIYIIFELELNPSQLSEFLKVLSLSEDLLRFTIFAKGAERERAGDKRSEPVRKYPPARPQTSVTGGRAS